LPKPLTAERRSPSISPTEKPLMSPISKATIIISFLVFFGAAACGPKAIAPSTGHLTDQPTRTLSDIPNPVSQAVVLPPPKIIGKTELYSVVVDQVPVRELLFALGRDAKINVDIHPAISGLVSMNAIEQTLPQILNRLTKQVDMRYELDGPNLVLLPDTPYLKSYAVDYVNISRDSTTTVSVATQIATTGSGGSGGQSGGDNNSSTSIKSTSNNRFWQTLVENIKDILRETDKVFPADGGGAGQTAPSASAASTAAPARVPSPSTFREAAAVIANPETGIIVVRATSRQHENIQELLTNIQNTARRQVLIEATVVEVQLSDQYQQGVDWRFLNNSQSGINLVNLPQGPNPLPTGATPGGAHRYQDGIFGSGNPATFLLNYVNPFSSLGGAIDVTVSLLESFGKVKVLSSPKISVLNNQTALLKVVDNKVYFSMTVNPATISNGIVTSPATYTSTINTVPVGFVMSVTPQIDATDTITLNVRPTITRITSYAADPNPSLATANVSNLVPEIQTREMESILKVHSGEVAIMGGLMQDTIDHKADGIPILSEIPGIGDLFRYRNEVNNKTELVIFLRPVVLTEAGRDSAAQNYREYLPDRRFFQNKPESLAPDNRAEQSAGGEKSP